MCFVLISEQTATLPYKTLRDWFLQPKWRLFTVRYALSPYIKQIRFVFKGLNTNSRRTENTVVSDKDDIYIYIYI
jgi:hypothetical protein